MQTLGTVDEMLTEAVEKVRARVTGHLEHLTDAERIDYLRHSIQFPLVPIRSDAELGNAITKIDELIDRPTLSRGDDLYLDILSDLVEMYESRHIEIPQASGVEMLRFLMEANDMQQKDLVPLLGSKSTVSEVLSGKRPLTLAHITRLSGRFNLPADVFIDRAPVKVSSPLENASVE
jgi:HTH-type transcriptional regulator/antitoxin HigA